MQDHTDQAVLNYAAGVLVDAWLHATARHWIRRAEAFEAARPSLESLRRAEQAESHPATPVLVPDVDWSTGWPTTCGVPACQASVAPTQCRHRRRPLTLGEVPKRTVPAYQGPTAAQLRASYDRLTQIATACRQRATLQDLAYEDLLDTFTDVAGAAA